MATERGIPTAGRIAYDAAVTKAQVAGQAIPEYDDGELRDQVVALWDAVRHGLEKNNKHKEK
jgi:hypothetical protein